MAESVVLSLLVRFADVFANVAVQEAQFLFGVRQEVDLLKDELLLMHGFLRDADNRLRSGQDEGAKTWVSRVRDIAYEAENAVEEADYLALRNQMKRGFLGVISRYACLPCDLVGLRNVGVEISRMRRRITQIREGAITYNIQNLDVHQTGGQTSGENTSPEYSDLSHLTADSDVVGLEEESKNIETELTTDSKDLSVVSIVAMGGAGKTTLAKKVYASVTAGTHFAASAFVTVSQRYSVVNLLKDIMKQTMHRTTQELENMTEDELKAGLTGFLRKKRFLIVLDDLWQNNPWHQISSIFLHGTLNGSRIILTTRSLEVGKQINKRTCVRELKPLDDAKSWELFCRKAFPSYITLSDDLTKADLKSIGQDLVKRCKGLPLAIVVLGGYLSKNLETNIWRRMRDLFHWETTKNEKNVYEILARSYYDLSEPSLKACFLSIASFPEGHTISASDLIKIWIGECFVPRKYRRTLDETAKEYMEELGQRCLVQVVSRSRPYGWIEKIRIHDVLRDWCLEEASRDGFLKLCCRDEDPEASSSNQMVFYRVAAERFFGHEADGMSRLVQNLRSLLGFELDMVSLRRFRYLRVLYLEKSKVANLSRDINGLIHLRYLGLRECGDVELPNDIGRYLLKLQTIDLSDTTISILPCSLWDVPNLRHVYLGVVRAFTPPNGLQILRLQTLVMKSYNHVDNYIWRSVAKALAKMTRLTVLEISALNLPVDILRSLQTHSFLLNVDLGVVIIPSRMDNVLLPNLVELTLRISSASEDGLGHLMQILKTLPKLEALSLEEQGHGPSNLTCSPDGFMRLQRLVLQSSIRDLTFQESAMPRLTQLTLVACRWLTTIRGLLHLEALQQLELVGMPDLPPEIYAHIDPSKVKKI